MPKSDPVFGTWRHLRPTELTGEFDFEALG